MEIILDVKNFAFKFNISDTGKITLMDIPKEATSDAFKELASTLDKLSRHIQSKEFMIADHKDLNVETLATAIRIQTAAKNVFKSIKEKIIETKPQDALDSIEPLKKDIALRAAFKSAVEVVNTLPNKMQKNAPLTVDSTGIKIDNIGEDITRFISQKESQIKFTGKNNNFVNNQRTQDLENLDDIKEQSKVLIRNAFKASYGSDFNEQILDKLNLLLETSQEVPQKEIQAYKDNNMNKNLSEDQITTLLNSRKDMNITKEEIQAYKDKNKNSKLSDDQILTLLRPQKEQQEIQAYKKNKINNLSDKEISILIKSEQEKKEIQAYKNNNKNTQLSNEDIRVLLVRDKVQNLVDSQKDITLTAAQKKLYTLLACAEILIDGEYDITLVSEKIKSFILRDVVKSSEPRDRSSALILVAIMSQEIKNNLAAPFAPLKLWVKDDENVKALPTLDIKRPEQRTDIDILSNGNILIKRTITYGAGEGTKYIPSLTMEINPKTGLMAKVKIRRELALDPSADPTKSEQMADSIIEALKNIEKEHDVKFGVSSAWRSIQPGAQQAKQRPPLQPQTNIPKASTASTSSTSSTVGIPPKAKPKTIIGEKRQAPKPKPLKEITEE